MQNMLSISMLVYIEIHLWRQKSAETGGMELDSYGQGYFSNLVSLRSLCFRFNLHDAEGLAIAPILWIRKLRHGEVLQLTQGYLASM